MDKPRVGSYPTGTQHAADAGAVQRSARDPHPRRPDDGRGPVRRGARAPRRLRRSRHPRLGQLPRGVHRPAHRRPQPGTGVLPASTGRDRRLRSAGGVLTADGDSGADLRRRSRRAVLVRKGTRRGRIPGRLGDSRGHFVVGRRRRMAGGPGAARRTTAQIGSASLRREQLHLRHPQPVGNPGMDHGLAESAAAGRGADGSGRQDKPRYRGTVDRRHAGAIPR